eukprot:SAG22_NODE_4350_length_1294_cov_2.367364_2_plen_83_part_00
MRDGGREREREITERLGQRTEGRHAGRCCCLSRVCGLDFLSAVGRTLCRRIRGAGSTPQTPLVMVQTTSGGSSDGGEPEGTL